jgi:hypothetical protein
MTSTATSGGRGAEEERLASVVLELALDEHPAHLSVEEVIRLTARDPTDFGDRDAVSNAIRDLVRDGLLHRPGDFVFAARAAVRTAKLLI